MKKAYLYDENKDYIGTIERQIDPLASNGKNIVYLMPANSTDLEPPQEKEGFKIKWNGKNWVYDEIKKDDPDEKTPDQKKAERKAELKYFLCSTDWYVIRQIETGEKVPQDISEQRAAARAELSK